MLNSKNLLYILNIKKNVTLITSDVLCKLLKSNKFNLLEMIFQYNYYDLAFIKKILFFSIKIK